jgi:hypothetical protein
MAKKEAPVTEAVIEAVKGSSALIPQATLDRMELTIKELTIESPTDAERANDLLHIIKEHSDTWEEFWTPLIKLANDSHKGLIAKAKPLREKFKSYRTEIETKLGRYMELKEQERQKAQAAIDEAAEAARQQQEEEAQELFKRGFVKKAEETRATAGLMPTPTVPDSTPALEGTVTRKNWIVEVVDLKAFVLAIADGEAPLEAITVDLAFLRKEARQREGLPWPGVSARQKKGFSVRG